MIQIAVLGYGTIGSGVAEVLKVNKESITKRVGDEISIKYILDLREFPGDPMEDKIVHDYAVIKNDPEIAIVVEAMGGVEPAYTFAKQALESGKHFATSNKALIAEKGAELIRIAKENAALNHTPMVECAVSDLLKQVPEKRYDVVVANIVADIIIRLAPDAGRYMKENGCFIVSGIIEERADEVVNALMANGFHIVKDAHENGWYCACVQK